MITKAIKHLIGLLRSEATETMQTPTNQEMIFYLTLKKVQIGRLHLHDGIWTYAYSDEFKQQSWIKPLVDFPTPEKVYEADTLWPFFESRIPSLNQPYVQDVVKRKKIDINNTAAMLTEFGHRTIANPFALHIEAQT